MWSNKSKCFVRTWHHQAPDQKTGRPLLLLTYRIALEKFTRHTDFEPVHYDRFSRDRVRVVSMNDRCVRVVLKQEPLLEGCGGVQRKRNLAFFEVERIQQGLLVLTAGLACSTRPEDDDVDFGFRGRLAPWVSEVFLSKNRVLGQPGDSELVVVFSTTALLNTDDCDSEFSFL